MALGIFSILEFLIIYASGAGSGLPCRLISDPPELRMASLFAKSRHSLIRTCHTTKPQHKQQTPI